MRSERALRIGGYVAAAATLALGIVMLVATARIQVAVAAHGAVGPKLFPNLVGGGLVAVGLVALRAAWRGRLAPEGVLELDLAPVAYIVAGLLFQIFTVETIGWIPATTVLFMAGSRAFGSRRIALDLLLGLAMSLVTFLLFDVALGLELPMGELFGG